MEKEKKSNLPVIGNISKKIINILPHNLSSIKVYGFVGKSGSGKSFRAQQVAFENNIESIIDDGLLIKYNQVLAGNSAKKAKTKVSTIKKALFMSPEERDEIKKALKSNKIKSLLILGTSDGMVEKIRENLGLNDFEKIIYIEEVASKAEIEKAINVRRTEGKHIVPVPTFEIKKDFSGIILDPFNKFKNKSNINPVDRSIIRPTFSYLGKFTIKDRTFRDIIQIEASKLKEVSKVNKLIITKEDKEQEDINISMDLVVFYGYNLIKVVEKFNNKIKEAIEKCTSVHNIYMETNITSINTDKTQKDEKALKCKNLEQKEKNE